jgi:hypothetical protein
VLLDHEKFVHEAQFEAIVFSLQATTV